MNARRTLAISKKVLRSLKHDKRSIALMLVAPILAMSIFGYAFGSEIRDVPVALVDEDAGPLAGRVVDAIGRDAIDLRAYASLEEAERALHETDVRAVLHFPSNFSANVQRRAAEVDLRLDGSNSQIAVHVQRHLQQAMASALESGGGPPMRVSTSYAYAEGAEYVDFFVPGIMAFAALMFTTLLTLLAFVGERTSGTLSRLLVTPVRGSEIVGGYALAFGLVATVQGTILLAVALWLFDAMLVGSLFLAFLVVALVSIDAMSLGILLSAAARRESQAVQMLPLVIFPTFLLSGIFVPVEALPSWLSPFAWAIFPTYAVEALRDVMLRGFGLAEVWPLLAGLVAFGAVFLGLASWGIDRQRAAR